jgi:hypothetical protein
MLRNPAISLPKNLAWSHAFVAWIKETLAASRQRRIARANTEYFRSLDPAVLDDIGVNIASADKGELSLADFHPCVLTANFITSEGKGR